MRLRTICLAVVCLALLLPTAAQAAGKDSDRDGMPDRWESRNGTRVHEADANKDYDHDGLSNINEYRLHTDPRRRDSDHDGLWDSEEIDARSDPNQYDTDNDGLDDSNEVDSVYGTDVNISDTDEDGVLDGDEDFDGNGIANEDEDDIENCLSGTRDRDHDHVADEDENEQNTDPLNEDSDGDGVLDGLEDSDVDSVLNEDEDEIPLDQCAALWPMWETLKNAATAEESFATGSNGAYTQDVNNLINEGLDLAEDVTLEIPAADEFMYCIQARHEEVPGFLQHYDSRDGRPKNGPCSTAT